MKPVRPMLLAAAILTLAVSAFAQVNIVEVSTRNATAASNEYVVLANAGTSPVNLQNYALRRRSGVSTTDNWCTVTASLSIPSMGHFLIRSSSYAGPVEGVAADYADTNANGLTGGLSDSAAVTVALVSSAGVQVDAVSWNGGAGTGSLHEGAPLATNFTTPATQALHRKRPGITTGLYTDTNDNSSDLEFTTKNPLNSTNTTLPVSVSSFSID